MFTFVPVSATCLASQLGEGGGYWPLSDSIGRGLSVLPLVLWPPLRPLAHSSLPAPVGLGIGPESPQKEFHRPLQLATLCISVKVSVMARIASRRASAVPVIIALFSSHSCCRRPTRLGQ